MRALMALNFCIADVQNGMGLYVALFLPSAVGWGPAQIGAALAAIAAGGFVFFWLLMPETRAKATDDRGEENGRGDAPAPAATS